LRMGTAYTADVEGWASDSRWLELYASTASASSPHLARFYLKYTLASTSTWGSAVRAEYQQAHPTGQASAGGQAVHAEAVLATGNTGVVNGYLAALRGVLTLDATTRTVAGTLANLFLTNNFGTGNTLPTPTSFIMVEDLGAVKTPFLLDATALTSGSGAIWYTTSGAVGTVLGYFAVKTPAGKGYLPVYGNHS
jgi:hypothetical protein